MNKRGRQTRQMILERASPLFNQRGYFGVSLSDLMQETGLEKGGIYNHFDSKEQLALEAFDYSLTLCQQRIQSRLAGKRHAVERLHAILAYFQDMVLDPPLPGGCPILNMTIEADDTQPVLCDRARTAMDDMRDTVERIVTKGVSRQELRPEADAAACATLFIALLEGAMMLSRLYQDPLHMRRAVAHLSAYIENNLRSVSTQ